MCLHFRARSTDCTKSPAHAQPIYCYVIPQKDSMIPYMAQTRHALNNQVLAIFFPSATIPAMQHYSKCIESTDNILHFRPPSPTSSPSRNYTAESIRCLATIPPTTLFSLFQSFTLLSLSVP